MELSYSRAEIFAVGDSLQRTGIPLTAVPDDVVAPPRQFYLGELEAEEDEDGRDGDGATERRRQHKVVLRPEAEVVPLEIDPRIPADGYCGPDVRYVVRTPLYDVSFRSVLR